MRVYQKNFEQNSLIAVFTFAILYVLAMLATENYQEHFMFQWPAFSILAIILILRFLMVIKGEDNKYQLLFSKLLIYASALWWSSIYGLELYFAEGFTDQQLLLIIFIMGISAAGAIGLSKDKDLTLGFLVCLIIPSAIFSLVLLQRLNIMVGVAFAMYFGYLLLYSRKYYNLSQENLVAKINSEKQKRYLEENKEVLTTRNTQLANALQHAKEIDKAKSLFLANMSHEIRTPLNGIVGMSYLMQQEEENSEQKDKLSVIQFSAETLISLVNDILDFSKIEAGKLELDPDHFDVYKLIENIRKLFLFQAKEKGIELMYNIENEVPTYIFGDQIRIKQILINLINNAIKFTERGHIRIQLEIQGKQNEDLELRFTISDTGIGIAKENQEKIFGSFTQSDASFTRKFGGTGLGLAISKELSRLMGGDIGLLSRKNIGSEFWFTIKAKEGKDQQDRTKIEEESEVKSLHVLLAEDNRVNVMVAKQILQKAGHKVTVANNGKEAVDFYKNEEYDLVLMDIMMPEMDGIEATQHIRKYELEKLKKTTPIIALTANVIKEDQKKYIIAGMNDYLSKPIHPDILIKKIRVISSKH
ncbi:MAG: hypothetical protein B7C24_11885 [Bacteroidetes bacterium 4572_77]|nr:MAG: hypothetical protein B7C24_11885 [Bacteroidetes bacterium 4572_77]